MASRFVPTSDAAAAKLRQGIAKIQQEQGVTPEFPAEVEQAAQAASPRLPDLDRTDLPFVTIDPPGARDLDQAMHLQRGGDDDQSGYTVRYAIADVAAFVAPGDPVDIEAHRRGESMYGGDTKVPLHPTSLSEGAASLLPGQVRPAFLWTLRLDDAGECTAAHVERARVRSTAQLDYDAVQQQHAGELYTLLQEIGERRLAIEAKRGGVDLPMPEQEIVVDGSRWRLQFREMLPVENWNAQISLMTGYAAGAMMVEHKVGLLRTLPPPPTEAVTRLRRTARALRIDWPEQEGYPGFVRRLDSTKPHEAAMIVACTSLLRGAGYVGFDGAVPEQPEHAALASVYAHCTAPLRRLVDRYALEICASICAGTGVPDWVRRRLDEIPKTMQESGRRAHAYERAVIDLVEAEVLSGRVGETFEAVVLERDDHDDQLAAVQVREPAIEAKASGAAEPGQEVTVKLTEADPATRTVRFSF